MPGSFLAEVILQPLAEITLQLAGYATARVLVPVITFGHWKVEPLGLKKTVYPRWRWPFLSGQSPRIMDGEVASLLGLIFWCFVAVTVYLFSGTA